MFFEKLFINGNGFYHHFETISRHYTSYSSPCGLVSQRKFLEDTYMSTTKHYNVRKFNGNSSLLKILFTNFSFSRNGFNHQFEKFFRRYESYSTSCRAVSQRYHCLNQVVYRPFTKHSIQKLFAFFVRRLQTAKFRRYE